MVQIPDDYIYYCYNLGFHLISLKSRSFLTHTIHTPQTLTWLWWPREARLALFCLGFCLFVWLFSEVRISQSHQETKSGWPVSAHNEQVHLWNGLSTAGWLSIQARGQACPGFKVTCFEILGNYLIVLKLFSSVKRRRKGGWSITARTIPLNTLSKPDLLPCTWEHCDMEEGCSYEKEVCGGIISTKNSDVYIWKHCNTVHYLVC